MTSRKQSPKPGPGNRPPSGPQGPRRGSARGPGGPKRGNRGGDDSYVYGFHVVFAALANPERTPKRLLLTRSAETEMMREGYSLPENVRIEPEIMAGDEITDILPPGAVHQGIALKASPLPELTVDEACYGARAVLVLDQVTDPHNFGAILRSAAVFGATGLVTTERNSPPLGGVLAKAASGALEKVKIAKVPNLVRAIEEMKKMGFEIIGLDGEGEHTLPQMETGPKVALVLGAEGAGLRRLTREHCDLLARLPASGDMKSLNVSNAAAVALYELFRRTL
ncbi:MAG: 23S rRNA (guanosine(2251)-2'-O)-methyltransferase RlmB [Rhizobiales bacterium]|nr:23S rRNA (guanosine(2251)-2'-O)-methyltransferase RlmB [Hyphomicrobiales bacterium]